LSSVSDGSNDPGMSEWQAARDVLDSYDERLHDLRKVGFSFVTGLLTVDALLTTSSNPNWKLAALLGTLFLIVPLDLVDRNYRAIEIAASIRAQILERRSRMDLTQAITRMFELSHVGGFFEWVYLLFALAVLLIGWVVFAPATSTEYWFSIAVLLVFGGVAASLSFWLRPRPTRNPLRKWLESVGVLILVPACVLYILARTVFPKLSLEGQLLHYHATLLGAVAIAMIAILYVETTVHINEWVDFGIDGYEYEQDEQVSLMISNLGHEDLDLTSTSIDPVWTVYREDHTTGPRFPSPPPQHLRLPKKVTDTGRVGWSERRWLISTDNLDPGLYRVVYNGPVYFRVGFPKRFKLLDRIEVDERYHYDPFYDAAQRFRVTEK